MNRNSKFANIVLSVLIAMTLMLGAFQVVDAHAASVTSLKISRFYSPDPAEIDRFVSPSGADNSDCTDKNNPCLTITYAFDQVAVDGEIIAVAEGVYQNDNIATTFVVKLSVNPQTHPYGASIYGGWNPDYSSQVGFSIIDGENKFRGVSIYGSPRKSFVLDHFIVRNGLGGGVYTSGMDLDITNGAIYNNNNVGDYLTGGGIYSHNGALTLYNLTIHGNFATSSGGGVSSDGTTVMNNVTVTNNTAGYEGGGINIGTGVISNSIIFGNHATNRGPDCYLGTAVTNNNIVGDTSNCSIFSAGNGNLLNVNPGVGNFIEGVGYQPLLPGSPAINAGSGCYGTMDQRGYPRVENCDIGAYEYTSSTGIAAQFVIAQGDFQRAAPNASFSESLAVAVLDGQGSPIGGQTITFSAPVSGASGTFTGGGTSIQVATGGDGVASASFTANNETGTYSVTADSPGLSSLVFTLQNLAWFVKPDGNDSNDCLSPATACSTINGALAKQDEGDTIFVASGVYTGYGPDLYGDGVVKITKKAILQGGWNSTFTVQNGYSTIDGENMRLGVNNYSSGTVLNRFVIINGKSPAYGGGVITGGDLTIINSTIRNNYAPYNGGGIFNSGTLTLAEVLVFNNKSQTGGGISSPNGLSLTILNSAIFNNVADYGGGLDLGSGSVVINNSTISGNLAIKYGGGIRSATSPVTLNNVTISDNQAYEYGGGVYNSNMNAASFTITNSILAENTAKRGGLDCGAQVALGSIKSGGHNIISNTTGCIYVAGPGDFVNTNPGLGTFLPSRGYHPVLSGSSAIDNGSNCYGTTDHRGVARVGQCDIGSYEYDPIGTPTFIEIVGGDNQRTAPNFTFSEPFSVVVLDDNGSPVSGVSVTFSAPAIGPSGTFANNTTIDPSIVSDASGIARSSQFTANEFAGAYTVSAASSLGSLNFNVTNVSFYVDLSGSDSNDCLSPASTCLSINGAITKAMEGDIIFVTSGTYTGSGSEVIKIDKSVTISGGWDAAFSSQNGYSVIDGQASRRGVNISAGVTATMQNVSIRNAGGYLPYGIFTQGTLSLNHCDVSFNNQYQSGGGIYNSGTLVVTDCIIHHNNSEGIFNNGHLTLVNTTVSHNKGGGVNSQDYYGEGVVIVISSNISNNYGPGIEIIGTLQVERSSISENVAQNGAGVYATGVATIESSTIFGNESAGPGGGIFAVGVNLNLNNVTISGNKASSGAGIHNHENGSSITIRNSILAGNTISTGSGPDCRGPVASAGYNILGTDVGCTIVASTGDQFNIDPLLGIYLPTQGYRPLLPGSPAINTGNAATCVATDQRGVARNGTCDKGAYEYVTPGSAVKLVIVEGSEQHIPLNKASVKPLRVAVLDAIGSPVSGVSVTFSAPASGPSGTFSDSHTNTTVATTNQTGVATASTYTANGDLGSYLVTASSNLGSVHFTLSNLVWFVSPSGSNSNDCTTPSTSCADVTAVLAKPDFYSGDTVWIGNGIYDIFGVNVVYVRKSATIVGGWNDDFTTVTGVSVFHDAISMPGDFYPKIQLNLSYLLIEDTGSLGVYNVGQTLIIEHSTIRNNAAGIENWGGTTRIINSTIGINSGNAIESRESGLPINLVVVTNSTINGSVLNGDGAGEFRVENSIVAVCGGDFVSNGYNIVGNAGDPNLFMCGGWLSTDVVGGAIPLDLSTIFNQTLTQDPASGQWYYPLVYHSVASENRTIDKIPAGNSCPETDQLGIVRPEGAACDIGASEYVYPRAGAGIYDDKANIWSYGGTWPTQKVTSAYGGSYRYATAAGASATAYFSGVQAKLYYTKNSSMGNLNIYIDDVLVYTLNQKSSVAKYKQIWLSPSYPDGVHKITFVRSSNKVNVDALEVIPAPDVISPAGIADLFAASATGTSYGQVNLQWTSVGDDVNIGTAASYQIRYSTSIIDTEAKWSAATAVTSGVPIPVAAGGLQNMTVTGLGPSLNYYFSIRAVDDGGNLGSLSNSPFAVALAPVPVPAGTYENIISGGITTWIYSGTWTNATTTGASGGNVAACSIPGGSAALVFNGSGFTLRYYTKKGNGSMTVYVDGVLKATLSQNSLSLATVWKTYSLSWPTPGIHVIQLVDSAGKVNFDNIIIAP